MRALFFSSLLLFGLAACKPNSGNEIIQTAGLAGEPAGSSFDDYWYSGKAELTAYDLEQARYGEVHKGNAVLVFVTEPFLKGRQVKSDNVNADDAVSVMKMNALRKFPTGLYDYSMMVSAFTPVDQTNHPKSLKVTCTSQEWCGHTFTQLNLDQDSYKVKGYSYFESEGDQVDVIPATVLEDELLNMIRIDPKSLPKGKTMILPGLVFSRLRHQEVKAEMANVNLSDYTGKAFKGKKAMLYSISFPKSQRTLAICYEQDFPHEILGWEENWESGWGASAKKLTTRATRKQTIRSDYWNKHGVKDLDLREKLGLP